MNITQINTILDEVYHYSRSSHYKGYNKHDGLNSPVLRSLLGWGRWPRMISIQGVMRFPVNLRPVLLVPKTYNPKGLSLFIMGLLDRFKTSNNAAYLEEAEKLLTLLATITSPGDYSGIAWGYHYPWQDPGFYAPSNTPNAVVSCFVCEAYLATYRITKNPLYLQKVNDCISFFLNDLKILKEQPEQLCLSYMPLPMTMRVMDVSILIAAVIAQYSELSGDARFDNTAYRLFNYVVSQQTSEGAWFYTDPPKDSHITHDNYHTGFILDAIWRYMHATDNFERETDYYHGLRFYAENLFNPNGAPRWMHNKDLPYDIHGSAQGIITFSRHTKEYPDLAAKICQWAIKNLYRGKGKFAYQKNKLYTKPITLLRWCNAWMCCALAKLLLAENNN